MACRVDVRASRALHGEAQRMIDASGRRVAGPACEPGEDRQARRVELQKLASEAAERVKVSGEAARLAPMNPFERKVVHDTVAEIDGVTSESEGEEPQRRVVVLASA